jgi:two-component system, chemotaxis family, sensor kinase CheA
MDELVSTHQTAFKMEAYELLSELESALLELEEIPDNEDLIGRVFRAMHTIKGSGAMFGFDAIAEFTHEVETIYDMVRDGKMRVTKELINLSLSSKDLIAEMLGVSEGDAAVDTAKAEAIIVALRALRPAASMVEKGGTAASRPPNDTAGAGSEMAPMVTYRIRFRPSPDIFAYGTNPILLLAELSELGECHIVAHTEEIPLLSEMAPENCFVFWDIILTTNRGTNAIEDVFIFVADTCEISIRAIDAEDDIDETSAYQKLGEILVDRGDLSASDVQRALDGHKRLGERLTDARMVSTDAVESALVEQQHLKKIREKRQEVAGASSLRVDAGKLDQLVSLVGELVTVQSRLRQRAASLHDGEMVLIAEEVERLVGELRDNTMSIRMLPIGTTFSKFKRLVRDLSDTLGKEVELTTEGGETELDKTVIEQLSDPLVHIIRNSIDHGIEAPAERVRAGKSREGSVRLKAAHIGANVVIRIEDDGAGLNAEAIRKSALNKGLIAPEAELSEKEIFGLIFAPGFSTAQTITGVSGRGVGMDVVKKSIETLRGQIEVASEKGRGTAIILRLPLTLAIIEGFMVKIGDGHYVFPLAAVEECVAIPRAEMEQVRKRNMVNIRGAVVPYQSLRETFHINGTPPAAERIVVVESGGQRVGFGVDSIIGQHQTVIKSLGKFYKDIKGVSGATILGDGTVALILDIVQLINAAERQA